VFGIGLALLHNKTVSMAVPQIDHNLHELDWQKYRSFKYNRLGAEGSSPKHHCGSQQTLCLVPSLGFPTSVPVPVLEYLYRFLPPTSPADIRILIFRDSS
jgi:hypothetical protein